VSNVVRTWQPAREPGGPILPRQIIEGGGTTDDKAVALFVEKYGQGARQDAVDSFGESGGVEWKVQDPAGKILGWVGYWYPEVFPNLPTPEEVRKNDPDLHLR
jgi:hypothetical protein